MARRLLFGLGVRIAALALLPLAACLPDSGPPAPELIATVAGPRGVIASRDGAYVTSDHGLYAVPLDRRSPTVIAPGIGDTAVINNPDGVTIDFAEVFGGIGALDTSTLATHELVRDVSYVEAMAVTHDDLYWLGQELHALDLRTGTVRVVAATVPNDDVYQAVRASVVADDNAAYVRTNRSVVRYERATGVLSYVADKLGVASGIAIEGGDLYVVDVPFLTRISIADGSVHELGRVQGKVEAIAVDGGVVTIATSESTGGFAETDNDDARKSWLTQYDDSGTERILAFRPTARIVGFVLTPDRVLFAERHADPAQPGALLSVPR